MRPLLLALMSCLASASAEAQLRDVRAARSGAQASVILEFAAPPAAVAAAPTAAGFVLNLDGAHLAPGVWEAAVADILVTMDIRSGDQGSVLAARTVDEVLSAQARVMGSMAVIDLELGALGSPMAALPAPAPMLPTPAPTRRAVKAPLPAAAASPPPPPAAPPAEDVNRVAVPAAAQALVAAYAGDTSESACMDADTQVRDDPWNFELVRQHGACLAAEGRVEEAREVFDRLLTFAPDDLEAHLGLGLTMVAGGDQAAARLHLEDALNLASTDADAARVRQLLEQLAAS